MLHGVAAHLVSSGILELISHRFWLTWPISTDYGSSGPKHLKGFRLPPSGAHILVLFPSRTHKTVHNLKPLQISFLWEGHGRCMNYCNPGIYLPKYRLNEVNRELKYFKINLHDPCRFAEAFLPEGFSRASNIMFLPPFLSPSPKSSTVVIILFLIYKWRDIHWYFFLKQLISFSEISPDICLNKIWAGHALPMAIIKKISEIPYIN